MSETRDETPAMQSYIRRPEPVQAVQWMGEGSYPELDYLGRERGGDYVVLRGVDMFLEHGCWIVEFSSGLVQVYTDAQFSGLFIAPASPPQGAAEGDAAKSAAWLIGKLLDRLDDDDKVALKGAGRYPATTVRADHLRALLAAAEARPQVGEATRYIMERAEGVRDDGNQGSGGAVGRVGLRRQADRARGGSPVHRATGRRHADPVGLRSVREGRGGNLGARAREG